MIVSRSINEPIRENLDWDSTWRGPDCGLIKCWENGRAIRSSSTDENKAITVAVANGELPVLDWAGGLEKPLKSKKQGSLEYLATLQGIKGESLSVDLNGKVQMMCRRTSTTVVFSGDKTLYEASDSAAS